MMDRNFYIGLLFIGIILIAASLIWIAIDVRKGINFIKLIEGKKQEITGIINDADQMIEELNNFSEYIVNQMDFKCEELRSNLKRYNEQIAQIKEKTGITQPEQSTETEQDTPDKKDRRASDLKQYAGHPFRREASVAGDNGAASRENGALKRERRYDRPTPADSRYKEVLRLSGEGRDETEIAKLMKMGKGEVQLLLEINK